MNRTNRLLAVFLTIAAVFWMAAIVFVPLRGPGPATVLTGTVTAAGGLLCHQRPERSFHVAGNRLPVCARCTGLYLSGALGALTAWAGFPRVPRRTRSLMIAAAIPTAVSVGAEWSGLANPGNVARALAALPLGGAAGWLFVRMLRAEGQPTTCVIIS